jgi:hypothetical protein
MVTIDPSSINLISYILIFILIFSLSIYFLRSVLWSSFDPLILSIFFVVFNVVCVIFFSDQVSLPDLIYVYGSYLLFLFILRLGPKLNLNFQKSLFDDKFFSIIFSFIPVIFQVTFIFFVLNKIGFGTLTGEADASSKVYLTQDGDGIFKYVIYAANLTLIPIIFNLYFVHRQKWYVFFLIFLILASSFIANFSKSGLFFMIFDVAIMAKYYNISLSLKKLSKSKLIASIFVIGIPVFLLISQGANERGVSINYLVVERFIDTGGGTYQYFILGGKRYLEDFDFLQKIYFYFDNILSILRFKSWEPLSYIAYMSNEFTGKAIPGFGANPYLFLDGHFLLGYFGFFYVALLAVLINLARSIKTNPVVFYILNKLALFTIGDPNTMQAFLFSVLLILILTIAVYCIYIGSKSNLHR